MRRPAPYDPATFWEHRAPGLIDAYAHPETWAERGWDIASSPEREAVPALLRDLGASSVLVAGAGSGRQYEYLADAGVHEIRGFDLSPTMVAECARRYPAIETSLGDILGSELRQQPADVVLAVTVLQHVRPQEIDSALASLRSLVRLALIVLEHTSLDVDSAYVFAHDYRGLMSDWELVQSVGVTGATGRMELLAWRRPF